MATYLLNILPTKTKNHSTPTYLLYRKHPTYHHLRTFGCLCYPLLPSTSIHKLQNRSTSYVFLGYPSDHRGYKCYELSTRKIIISRHVVFDEHVFPFATRHSIPPSYEFFHSSSDDLHPAIWKSVSMNQNTTPPPLPPNQHTTTHPSSPTPPHPHHLHPLLLLAMTPLPVMFIVGVQNPPHLNNLHPSPTLRHLPLPLPHRTPHQYPLLNQPAL